MNREQLLSHLQFGEERNLGGRIVDFAAKAWETSQPQSTDFYDPQERKIARSVLDRIPEVGVLWRGGHKQAERARLVVYPQFYLVETIPDPLRVLEVRGDFSRFPAGHGDFLGAVLGLGIKRGKIGDLVVIDAGCQLVVAAEIAEFLLSAWNRVGPATVTVREIEQEQLAVEPQQIKTIRATVASLRLDAIAAEGYGTSRSKIAREIKAERLKLNWKAVSNPALAITQGDVLSIRGRGRVVVSEVGGLTRKGRTSVILHRYL